MLATFSAQKGGRCESPPSFLLRYFFESIFFEMLTHFRSMLLHFGAKLAPFWLHVAAILVPSWRYLGPLWPHELALDGLVGLRRVSVHRSASAGSRSEKNFPKEIQRF